MKPEVFSEIDPMALAGIHGGQSKDRGQIGWGLVELEWTTSDYRVCLDNLNRQASELYPDNRWFWQRWRGDQDENAIARNAYISRRQTEQCPLPSTQPSSN